MDSSSDVCTQIYRALIAGNVSLSLITFMDHSLFPIIRWFQLFEVVGLHYIEPEQDKRKLWNNSDLLFLLSSLLFPDRKAQNKMYVLKMEKKKKSVTTN